MNTALLSPLLTPDANEALDRAQFKRALVFSLLFAFAAHAFCWFNLTYSGQGMAVAASSAAAAQENGGQYLLPLYWRIRGAVSAPLWVGLLSAAALALNAACVSALLGVRRAWPLALLCGALTVHAGITSVFAASLHIADAVFLAQLLSTLGVCLCFFVRPGFLPGALLLCAAAALDAQAPACFFALFIAALIVRLAAGQPMRRLAASALRTLLAFALGAGLYALGFMLLSRLGKIDAQAQLHLPASFADAFLRPLRALFAPLTVYPALNAPARGALLLLALAAFARYAPKAGAARSAVLLMLLALMLPAVNLPVFSISAAPQFPLAFAYPDALALSLLGGACVSHKVRRLACAGFSALLLGCVIFSNQVYLKKNLEFSATLSAMTRIFDRIEQTEGYQAGFTPVVFIGTLEDSLLDAPHQGFEHLRALDAASADFAFTTAQELTDYVWQVLGYPLNLLGAYEAELMAENPTVAAMPCYPLAGSVRIVDGTLVVRLTEQNP